MDEINLLILEASLKALFDRKSRMTLSEQDKVKALAIIEALPEQPDRPCHVCQTNFEVNCTLQGFEECKEHLKEKIFGEEQ